MAKNIMIKKEVVFNLSYPKDVGEMVTILTKNQYNTKVEYHAQNELYPYQLTVSKVEVKED